MRVSRGFLVLIIVLVAGSAGATFRAADLVVVPVAAALPGYNNSNWRTDVEITNVDSVAVDVEIVFLPTAEYNNVTWYQNIENHLGGRSGDAFGHIDERLRDIQPGAVVTIDDIIAANWGEDTKGALLVFAFQAGTFSTTDPPGGVPKKVVVRARTYDLGETEEGAPTSYGQGVPGIPWYFYIDPSLADEGYNLATFSGIQEDDAFRTAVGLLNISDPMTTLDVRLGLYAADGTLIQETFESLQPLAHAQYDKAVRTLFFVADDVMVAGATVKVEVAGWRSTAAEPTPALIAYVSRIDNVTNDPVYVEQAYSQEFPWDCVFNGNCPAASAASPHAGGRHKRPLEPVTP